MRGLGPPGRVAKGLHDVEFTLSHAGGKYICEIDVRVIG